MPGGVHLSILFFIQQISRAGARPWGVSDEGLALGKHVV